MFSPDASTTGGAITGHTSPTFTLASVLAPFVNAKKWLVSALGGTQGTATANTVSSPFDLTFFVPQVLRALPAPNPVTGARGKIPMNQYKFIIRKGGEVASGVPAQLVIRTTIDVPAGMETYNPDNVKASVGFLVGVLTEEINDVVDTLLTGGI